MEAKSAPVSVTLIHPGRIDTPYNEHAHGYIAQQPAHRGMIYPPEAVAEAVLRAAETPLRDVYVGFQATAVQLAGALVPRLLDKAMERYTPSYAPVQSRWGRERRCRPPQHSGEALRSGRAAGAGEQRVPQARGGGQDAAARGHPRRVGPLRSPTVPPASCASSTPAAQSQGCRPGAASRR